MNDQMPSIDLQDVRKTYKGRVHALRGVDIRVHPGEIYGLLGPNGAGKSTLVKIMMTVVRPTKVHGTLLGKPVGRKSTLASVGYLPENHRFPQWLTGREAIEFAGAMCKMPRLLRKARTEKLLDQMRMTSWANKRIGTYSKGMQQRIGLAAALVNDPELVLLDEPTDGVDPVGRREIRDILVEMRDEGRSVLVNSHILSELELVCDRVGILVKGVVSKQGTLDDLTAESQRFELICSGEAPNWLNEIGARSNRTEDGRTRIILPTADTTAVQPLIDRLRSDGYMIESLLPVRESLEDLFIRAVQDPVSGRVLEPGAGDVPPSAPPQASGGGTS